MSATTDPATFFGAGYSLASSVAGFNTNDAASNKLLTLLTDTEANATTGDAREITRALCEMLLAKYLTLAAANRPANMVVSASEYTDNTVTPAIRTRTISFQFKTNPAEDTLIAES